MSWEAQRDSKSEFLKKTNSPTTAISLLNKEAPIEVNISAAMLQMKNFSHVKLEI